MRRLALLTSVLLFACSSDSGSPAESDTDATDDAGDDDDSDDDDSNSSVTDPTGPLSTTGGTDATTDPSESESESETDDPTGSTTDDTSEEPTSPACGMDMQTDWFAPYTASWGGETHRATVDVGGTEREYIIEFPDPYDPNTPYPFVIGFHGFGGTMDNIFGQQLGREFDNQAIVVYPQGLGATSGWSYAPSSPDIDMFDAILEQVENELCVDRTRIFTWGFSAGGYFTNVLACVRGDVIDGSSPVAAGMPLASLDCVGPVPQFIAHGDADTVVSVAQGQGARDIWLNLNGCSDTTVPHETESECVRYEDCESGDPVVWCELAGVGHGVHQDMGMEAPAIAFLRSL